VKLFRDVVYAQSLEHVFFSKSISQYFFLELTNANK